MPPPPSPPAPEDDPNSIDPAAEANPEYAGATGKGDLHIPGSGTIGIVLLLMSLSVLFIASTLAFVIIRVQVTNNPNAGTGGMWPPPGLPAIPKSLWLSTLVILATSVTIQVALNAIRKDLEKKLLKFLYATLGLGVLFLILQAFNWWEFYTALPKGHQLSGPYLGGFYVLTGLHAAHVIGGLIPLIVVIVRALQGRYSRNFHPGVRYVTLYWHFLDIVWVVLFLVLLF
jgi:cytochrome c oxidase subunit 3